MICISKSETGMRKRNEDCAFAPPPGSLCSFVAVADGMGGAAAGNLASSTVIDSLRSSLTRIPEADEDGYLLSAVAMANEAVYTKSKADKALAGMGTTLVMAALYPTRCTVLNVGDSRLYHLSGRKFTQVTKDHSYVAMLVDSGVITPEEAKTHPNRNLITRALGIEPEARADVFHITWKKGDTLLLCSDGLSGVLEPDRMKKILSARKTTPEEKADLLIRAALEAGSTDNITAVLAINDGEAGV